MSDAYHGCYQLYLWAVVQRTFVFDASISTTFEEEDLIQGHAILRRLGGLVASSQPPVLLIRIGPCASSNRTSPPSTSPFWRISHSPRSLKSHASSRIPGIASRQLENPKSASSPASKALATSDGQKVFGGSRLARNSSSRFSSAISAAGVLFGTGIAFKGGILASLRAGRLYDSAWRHGKSSHSSPKPTPTWRSAVSAAISG